MSKLRRYHVPALCFLCAVICRSSLSESTSSELSIDVTTHTAALERGSSVCEEFAKGMLTDEDLRRLVPEDSSGTVYIRWKTTGEYNLAGFNILRTADLAEPYKPVNKNLIPGNAPTDVPRDYCFADRPLPRGQVFYYSVQTVNDKGLTYIVKGTEDTRIKVKTVQEEREWFREKALGKGPEMRKLPPSERIVRLPLNAPHQPVTALEDRQTTALY